MRRLLRVLFLLTFTACWLTVLQAQNPVTVSLSTSNPQLTVVDPFANGLTPSNPLKPPRPFWYVVDKNGLTIVGLRTEKTGALMVGGPPIDVKENEVVGYVPWPDAIPITQPDGEVPTDPSIAADHNKFAWRAEVGGIWEPVGITISYPTDEALASNSETPPTYIYVVMKHSGREWQSTPLAELPAGRDPNLRDKIAAQTDLTKDGSLLVQVDVSQPNYPVDLFPTGAPIGGGLLGHDAGQPAFDPASDSVYVGNMPTLSLPTTTTVPNDLTSFVSVVTLAPGELPAPGEGAPAPVTVTVLCGPEHPDIALLAGFPESWACIAEGGEGPFTWTFTNLPTWLTAHIDPITGQGDGILYGTPPEGNYSFQAHVDDNATTPPGTGDATINLIVSADPLTEYENGELEWEVGVPGAVAIEGTKKAGATGDACALVTTLSPGSLIPAWVDVIEIPGRTIDNTAVGGPVESTVGCVVMGTPPISGERFEFQMPNLQFVWPSQNLPVVISGQIAGPYIFDPLPAGVGLSGLAWHQIDKIHDASTEADLLNREFFGVEPYTGQVYRVVAPYAGLEAEGTVVPPPALQGELDEIEPYTEVLTPLLTARPDIAAALTADPNLKVKFGNVAVEANPNAQVFVTATEVSDSTGVNPTVIPIGGAVGSSIPIGALIKLSGTRDAQDPEALTFATASAIDLPGVQGFYLGLDSDLAPAVPGEPAQYDNHLLWVTGTPTGNVATVDTVGGTYTQLLTIAGANSLGGVSVYPLTRKAYVASPSTNSVTVFGPGSASSTAPVFWSAASTTFTVGTQGWFKVTATGSPMPTLSLEGTRPDGVTFTPNGDGTAILAGIPSLGTDGSYTLNITATNSVSSVTQAFTLTVNPGIPPVITSANTTVFTVGVAGSFTVTATGSPKPTLAFLETLPGWLTFTDNGNGSGTLAGTPILGTENTNYSFTITAANGVGSPVTQSFTLTVNPGTPPAITSTASATFTEGSAGSFLVTATGSPVPSLSYAGTLPAGVTLTPNLGGTATLAGTPAPLTHGNYTITITAANGLAPDASQTFTLIVNEPPPTAPKITSATAATFTVGAAGSFTVTTTGWPIPTIYQSGTLPNGVSFKDLGNGTATLVGTPAAGTEKSYEFTIMAWNTQGLDSQVFTLTVNAASGTAPTITSANSTTFTVGSAGSFTVTATGSPTPQIIVQGTLPSGVVFLDGVFSGTPAPGSQGSYPFTITASNGVPPNATQLFTLIVNLAETAPQVTAHPSNQTVTAGQAVIFTAAASGNPTPTVQWQLSTNGGAGWSNINDATSTSYNTGATTTAMNGYQYRAVFTNSAGSATSNAATLTVNAAPQVTNHPSNQTVTEGQAATFTAAASGNPTPTVQWQVNGGAGWSNIGGATNTSYNTGATTTAMNGYQYRAVFTNSAGSATSNAATLTVNAAVQPLTIVTTSLPNGTLGQAYSSTTLQAQGGTTPYRWSSNALPRGLRLSSAGVLSGTPSRAGTFTFTVRVTDAARRSASKSFTVVISR